MIVAVVLAELLQPAFSTFTGIDFNLSFFQDMELLGSTLGLLLFVALFAGSYPAFFLSSFNTTKVIRGELTRGRQGLTFRNTLVVGQFAIAITLLIATVVIHQQHQLATSMDLGFNKDQIVIVNSPSQNGFTQDWTLLKQELLKNPAIEQVTASHFLPFGFNDNQMPLSREGSSVETRIQYMLVDFDFFETYDMNLLEGRFFTEASNGQTATVVDDPQLLTLSLIINESAARALGMSNVDSIDARVKFVGSELVGKVVGVVGDTYFESIHVEARPLLFILAPPSVEQPFQEFRTGAIKVRADAIPQALAHIDATMKKLYPNQAINRHFLDDDFQAMYQLEAKQAQLFTWFSALAILIACFGLFGLASFNAERRTKEIGIRKVMGGSVWSIVLLLTNDFSRLVLLSNLIAWPVAYFAMSRWLENFAYRIDLTPLIFIGSGLIALCIAWVTVGGTAAKAASAKPVLALRYE
jgi:putative ABC transport system permease protein